MTAFPSIGASARLLVIGCAGILLLTSCSRNPPVAAPPPPPVVRVDPFETAEAAYSQGLLAAAADAYRRALDSDSPTSSPNQEISLGRLALIHSLPGSPLFDLDEAREQLRRLSARFPESMAGAPARSLIDLQGRIATLEAAAEEMQFTLDALETTIAGLESARSQQVTAIHMLEGEVEKLRVSLNRTQTELETLREIDRQLRQRN